MVKSRNAMIFARKPVAAAFPFVAARLACEDFFFPGGWLRRPNSLGLTSGVFQYDQTRRANVTFHQYLTRLPTEYRFNDNDSWQCKTAFKVNVLTNSG